MKNKGFEDLEIWKLGVEISTNIYTVLKNNKDFGFRDQIQRSAVSIPSNIAEGYERNSKKEFQQFLYYSKGSCAELRTQLIIAKNIEYIDKDICDGLLQKALTLSVKINNFINYVQNQK